MPPKLKFTSLWVESLPLATDEQPRLEYRDSEVPGLVLRVGRGSKTYYLFKRKRVQGKSVERKIKLGLAPQLTPQGARRLASKYLHKEGATRERGSIDTSESIRLDEEMLTTKEAAELTRMSCAWFERQRWEGQGPPFYRAGRAVRYLRSELFAWWKQRRGI